MNCFRDSGAHDSRKVRRRTEDAAVASGPVIALPARFARDPAVFATRAAGAADSERAADEGGER
jgi:hypothetical protein